MNIKLNFTQIHPNTRRFKMNSMTFKQDADHKLLKKRLRPYLGTLYIFTLANAFRCIFLCTWSFFFFGKGEMQPHKLARRAASGCGGVMADGAWRRRGSVLGAISACSTGAVESTLGSAGCCQGVRTSRAMEKTNPIVIVFFSALKQQFFPSGFGSIQRYNK